MPFVFGRGGGKGEEAKKKSMNSHSRPMNTSYKENFLSPGCGGFLVNHEENEDILNGWKVFYAKMNAEAESSRGKDDSDGEDNDGRTGQTKYPVLSVTAEQYSVWCQPWMNSLIIKLLGVQVPKHILIDRVR